jgi:hypothetical protein
VGIDFLVYISDNVLSHILTALDTVFYVFLAVPQRFPLNGSTTDDPARVVQRRQRIYTHARNTL